VQDRLWEWGIVLRSRHVLLGRRERRESDRVIEFCPSRVEAEAMLSRVVGDEPDCRDILHVEPDRASNWCGQLETTLRGRRRRAMPLGDGAAYAQLLTDR